MLTFNHKSLSLAHSLSPSIFSLKISSADREILFNSRLVVMGFNGVKEAVNEILMDIYRTAKDYRRKMKRERKLKEN